MGEPASERPLAALNHSLATMNPKATLRDVGEASATTGPRDLRAVENAIAALKVSCRVNLLRMMGPVELEGHLGCPLVLHVVGHIKSPPRLLDGWFDGVDETQRFRCQDDR